LFLHIKRGTICIIRRRTTNSRQIQISYLKTYGIIGGMTRQHSKHHTSRHIFNHNSNLILISKHRFLIRMHSQAGIRQQTAISQHLSVNLLHRRAVQTG
jgi:phage replication-related protein YjqB (UPF0714/DUF867 family)